MGLRFRIHRVSAAATAAVPVFLLQAAPTGAVGVAYSYTFTASGTPTFALGTGTLPAGLTLSSSGVLSGTPTTATSYTFTVAATNPGGTTYSVSQSVAVSSFANVPGPAGATSLALAWTLPTTNADGSTPVSPAITNQRILYDTVSRAPFGGYAYAYYIADGVSTSATIPSLAAGTYYSVHETYNGLGWSSASPEVAKASA